MVLGAGGAGPAVPGGRGHGSSGAQGLRVQVHWCQGCRSSSAEAGGDGPVVLGAGVQIQWYPGAQGAGLVVLGVRGMGSAVPGALG